jgi:hypothetical protein
MMAGTRIDGANTPTTPNLQMIRPMPRKPRYAGIGKTGLALANVAGKIT